MQVELQQNTWGTLNGRHTVDTFVFMNPELREFLASDRWKSEALPQWARVLAAELKELTSKRLFDVTLDERLEIPTSSRPVQEIERLADWAVFVCGWDGLASLNQVLRRSMDDDFSTMLFLFEHWFMSEENRGFYILAKWWPNSPVDTSLQSTIGNVAAATGLAVLDRLLMHGEELAGGEALLCLSHAWDLARIGRFHDSGLISDYFKFADRDTNSDWTWPEDCWELQARVVGKTPPKRN
jgi:hypothetical protein